MSAQKKFDGLPPEQQESAALAALGLLPARDSMAVPRSAIADAAQAAALLAETLPLVTPPPSLKQRLMARVDAFEQLRPVADIRRDEDTWISAGAPGVEMKRLFDEPALGRSTYLIRMQPGARIPKHRHGDVEQCLVLDGDIRWGDIVYERGDFIAMGRDTEHPEIYSQNGNLLLLISGHNDFNV
jgi:anti-sigma factor ChrR (cupin superfamily)